jgi:uncharacterized protein with PQ loop repeat
METTEIIGYIAMTLLIISFIPKQMRIVRAINLCACLTFVVYGIFLDMAMPLIISNAIVSMIQIYHLFFAKDKKTA